MKTTITLVFLLFVQISFAQNYFNTISSKEKKEKVEVQIPTEVKEPKKIEVNEQKEKKKEFYITITQKLKNEVLSTNLIQKKKDSIYNYKFNYYQNKIKNTKKKNYKQQYLNELRFLKLEHENTSIKHTLKIQSLAKKILRNKDTIALLIKLDILKKRAKTKKTATLEDDFKDVQSPIKSKIIITSSFGNRTHPVTNKKHFHNGIDIRAKNKPVYSILPGKVTKVDYSKDLGIYVEISHKDNIKSVYGHLSKILLLENAIAELDSPIGISGNTGISTAPHLHLIVKKGSKYINPKTIF